MKSTNNYRHLREGDGVSDTLHIIGTSPLLVELQASVRGALARGERAPQYLQARSTAATASSTASGSALDQVPWGAIRSLQHSSS
jgi:hypothetical protein